jgi:competence ComEA-like helix-hairpin-helix protein
MLPRQKRFLPGQRAGVMMLALLVGLLAGWRLSLTIGAQQELQILRKTSLELEKQVPFYADEHRKKGNRWYASGYARNRSAQTIGKIPPLPRPTSDFDPNRADSAAWVSLGVYPRKVRGILAFRKSIGGFHNVEDLQRCRSLSPRIAQAIAGVWKGRSQQSPPTNRTDTQQKEPKNLALSRDGLGIRSIEVNTADTGDWKKLAGIGSGFARKIIRYRERLGGFVRREQLLEIPGIDSSMFQTIAPLLMVDTSLVQRIPLNRVGAHQLRFHPYFNGNLASALVNFRDKHGGRFASPADLKRCMLVSEDVFQRIAPYISFETP